MPLKFACVFTKNENICQQFGLKFYKTVYTFQLSCVKHLLIYNLHSGEQLKYNALSSQSADGF